MVLDGVDVSRSLKEVHPSWVKKTISCTGMVSLTRQHCDLELFVSDGVQSLTFHSCMEDFTMTLEYVDRLSLSPLFGEANTM